MCNGDVETSREPIKHKICGCSLKVTFDYQIEDELEGDEEEEVKEESKPYRDYLRITAEVLKVNDNLHCVDFQLKKHIVRKDDKDDIEIDITFEYKEKFICFVRETLISSKYIKDYVDATYE